jgi:hypothetical protein
VELAALFAELAHGGAGTASLTDVPWASGVRGAHLFLDRAGNRGPWVSVTSSDAGPVIHWRGTPARFGRCSECVGVLDAAAHGHRYLAMDGERQVTVIISKNEYPPDLA